jgi:hypothetical protein
VPGTTCFPKARAGTPVLIVERCIAAKIGRLGQSMNKSINQSINQLGIVGWLVG